VEVLRPLAKLGFMDLQPPRSTKLVPASLLLKEKRKGPDLMFRKPREPGKSRKPRLTKLKNEEKMLEPRSRKLKKKKGNR